VEALIAATNTVLAKKRYKETERDQTEMSMLAAACALEQSMFVSELLYVVVVVVVDVVG